jgi:hypothetical protein
LKTCLLNIGFIERGKSGFAVMRDDTSPKFDRKSPDSRFEKINGVKRKTGRRPKNLKSDDWYKQTALSMAIKREATFKVDGDDD